jgi:hypothetical protein
VLNEPALEPILRDLLRFVQEHVHAKRAAPLTIVLLSSDAFAAETVGSCACSHISVRTVHCTWRANVARCCGPVRSQGDACHGACALCAWVT